MIGFKYFGMSVLVVGVWVGYSFIYSFIIGLSYYLKDKIVVKGFWIVWYCGFDCNLVIIWYCRVNELL